MNETGSYLALAYIAQTVSKVVTDLVPLRSAAQRRLLREWSSSGTGIALAVTAKMDMLADAGVDLGNDAIGYVVTGLILGHGVQYAVNFFSGMPWKGWTRKRAS